MTDINKLQLRLEKLAVKNNGGQCTTYSYCRYCEQPDAIRRISETPCADAYNAMKAKYPERRYKFDESREKIMVRARY